MTIPAGSAYATEQAEIERQAADEVTRKANEVAATLAQTAAVQAEEAKSHTKATASAIELGTFEPGHDESDLTTEDEPNG